jgi:hypothetical protein
MFAILFSFLFHYIYSLYQKSSCPTYTFFLYKVIGLKTDLDEQNKKAEACFLV